MHKLSFPNPWMSLIQFPCMCIDDGRRPERVSSAVGVDNLGAEPITMYALLCSAGLAAPQKVSDRCVEGPVPARMIHAARSLRGEQVMAEQSNWKVMKLEANQLCSYELEGGCRDRDVGCCPLTPITAVLDSCGGIWQGFKTFLWRSSYSSCTHS